MAKKTMDIGESRVRCFWFSSRVVNNDNKVLISESVIKKALTEHVTVESYAYILHDKDVITKYDKEVDEEGHSWGNIGAHKPNHYHVVVQLSTGVALKYISRWFGIPINLIKFQRKDDRRSKDPYLDVVAYLTHEFCPPVMEKYIYPRSEVIIGGLRMDIWDDIDRVYGLKERKKRYHINEDDLNIVLEDVATKGVTLAMARKTVGEVVYIRNEGLFRKARQSYVQNVQPMPGLRTVFYVECVSQNKDIGKGGVGKTVCTHALAKQFAREFGADIHKSYDELRREGYVFDLGGEGVSLQSYDGQPVLVMNDMDSYSMFKAFGRRGTKEVLDNFPSRQDSHIKYGDTIVTAKYVIINGIERYDKFIKGLAGLFGEMQEEDKDLTQYYRRFFAHITLVNEEYMDIFFTKCMLDDTDEYREYYAIRQIYAPFKQMIMNYDNVAITDAEGRILKVLVDKSSEREDRLLNKKKDSESEEFKDLMARIEDNQKELNIVDTGGFTSIPTDEKLPFD